MMLDIAGEQPVGRKTKKGPWFCMLWAFTRAGSKYHACKQPEEAKGQTSFIQLLRMPIGENKLSLWECFLMENAIARESSCKRLWRLSLEAARFLHGPHMAKRHNPWPSGPGLMCRPKHRAKSLLNCEDRQQPGLWLGVSVCLHQGEELAGTSIELWLGVSMCLHQGNSQQVLLGPRNEDPANDAKDSVCFFASARRVL